MAKTTKTIKHELCYKAAHAAYFAETKAALIGTKQSRDPKRK